MCTTRLDLVLDVHCVGSLRLQRNPRKEGYYPHLEGNENTVQRADQMCLPIYRSWYVLCSRTEEKLKIRPWFSVLALPQNLY